MLDYALLFVGAFAAAAVSGAAGFGGALLLLPLLVATVGVTHAVPLLTIAQLIGNLSRAGFGFAQIRWQPVGLFLLGAAPLSVLGALSFVELPKPWVTRAIGAAILVFVALKLTGVLRLKPGPATLIVGGGVVGFLSGLVGSGRILRYAQDRHFVASCALRAGTVAAAHLRGNGSVPAVVCGHSALSRTPQPR